MNLEELDEEIKEEEGEKIPHDEKKEAEKAEKIRKLDAVLLNKMLENRVRRLESLANEAEKNKENNEEMLLNETEEDDKNPNYLLIVTFSALLGAIFLFRDKIKQIINKNLEKGGK